MKRIRLASLAVLVAAAAAPAEEYTRHLVVDPGGARGKTVRCFLSSTPAGGRPGGYGYLTVELENRHGESHTVGVELTSLFTSLGGYRFERSVRLKPGERARVFLPLPTGDSLAQAALSLDGRTSSGGGANRFRTTSQSGRTTVLYVGDRPEDGRRWMSYLEEVTTGRGGRGARLRYTYLQQREPQDLPDRWQLLTGFDMVLLDGAARGLEAETQELLAQYVAAGGHLLAVRAHALTEGPLARLLAGGEPHDAGVDLREGLHRFGTWLALGDASIRQIQDLTRAGEHLAIRVMRAWLVYEARGAPLAARNRGFSGPLHDELYLHLTIPGLGKVPVRLFFLLILGFAILVGPVNYVYLRRKRRLMWLLVTVPVAGFGMTGLILLYGILGEGFGTKGVIRSLTLLDQRTHESVTCAGRTLYAGLSPGELTPAPATHLYCADLAQEVWGDAARLHSLDVDLDRAGRIDGALLPSRTPTAYFTCTLGRQRERLRFRRLASGEYELLAGPGLRPAAGAGTVLFRDIDGRWFSNRKDGRMVPADDLFADVHQDIVLPFLSMFSERSDLGYRARHLRGEFPLGAWFVRVLGEKIPPGSYLARVDAFAGLDHLGLDVEYLEAAHVVHGTLAKEDLVE